MRKDKVKKKKEKNSSLPPSDRKRAGISRFPGNIRPIPSPLDKIIDIIAVWSQKLGEVEGIRRAEGGGRWQRRVAINGPLTLIKPKPRNGLSLSHRIQYHRATIANKRRWENAACLLSMLRHRERERDIRSAESSAHYYAGVNLKYCSAKPSSSSIVLPEARSE